MSKERNYKAKGFTLVEMVVVVGIISVLAMILIPTLMSFMRRARITAAVADARTIKTTIEGSVMQEITFNPDTIFNGNNVFNKRIYTNIDAKQWEFAGAFTSFTWYQYKNNNINENDGDQQKIEKIICEGLNGKFSESWLPGNKAKNPLPYNKPGYNCANYLSDQQTNFGLLVVYDSAFDVRFMQIYRKGILVTFVNGEFIANDNKDASFIGGKTWDTVYTDVGKTAPPGLEKMKLDNHQRIIKNGSETWPTWGY